MIVQQSSSPLFWSQEAQPQLLYAFKIFGTALTSINQQRSAIFNLDQARSSLQETTELFVINISSAVIVN
ncbi:hypothetical protein [Nostoc sp.]|uniref:hypothetical protein n=1 Tax=Nostoc sp. TaxID=1180 RepID=UPI002FF8A9D7